MATITIRLSKESEQILQEIEEVYKYRQVNRSIIVKAAIKAFAVLDKEQIKGYLRKTIFDDNRRQYDVYW